MTPAERKTLIETELNKRFSPDMLRVTDESDQHIGHAGARGGASHFAIEISAEVFKGKTRVQAHRMIYEPFASLIPDEIHALRISIV